MRIIERERERERRMRKKSFVYSIISIVRNGAGMLEWGQGFKDPSWKGR